MDVWRDIQYSSAAAAAADDDDDDDDDDDAYEQALRSARIGPLQEATGYDVEIRAVTSTGVGRTSTLRFVVPKLRTPSHTRPADISSKFLTLPYLTFGVGRLLHLPSAEAVSVRPNAQPRCNQKVTVIACEAETSAVKPKSAVKLNKSPATWDW